MKAKKIFSLTIFISCVVIMLFCAIVRITGCLWFTADLSLVKVPSKIWQDIIMALLLIFDLIFAYKILCRCKWFTSIVIATVHTIISAFIPNVLYTQIFHISFMFIISILMTRKLLVIVDFIILYLLEFLYAIIFIVGRIGNFDMTSSTNFILGILSTIDFKLFIVSLYMCIKTFGGIRLWKTQKRLIFQTDLKTKKA